MSLNTTPAGILNRIGALGGIALEGNYRAKMANPDDYQITLDRFSHDINQAVIDLAIDMAKVGIPDKFNKTALMTADTGVRNDNDMIKYFPGNALWMGHRDMEHLAQSPGSEIAILAQDEAELGRRPEEYADNLLYSIETSSDERFIRLEWMRRGKSKWSFYKQE